MPLGPRDNRTYSVAPDWRLHLGTAHVRIGDEETTLDQIREWTTRNEGSDRPFIRLERMTEAATLSDPADIPPDALAWLAEIDAALAASRSRDLLIYVHGANTTVERAAGQAAMLKHFAGREAVVVLFAWPTAENFLRYARDIRTALGSARSSPTSSASSPPAPPPGRSTSSPTPPAPPSAATPSPFSPARPPTPLPASAKSTTPPPMPTSAAFVDDLAAYAPHARRVTAAVNLGDSALRLAQAVTRASRAGRPDLAELSPDTSARLLAASAAGEIEIVQVHPDRMPELAATSHTFWYDHPWASNHVLLTLLFHLPPPHPRPRPRHRPLRRRLLDLPEDYPARMPAVVDAVRAAAAAPGASG